MELRTRNRSQIIAQFLTLTTGIVTYASSNRDVLKS